MNGLRTFRLLWPASVEATRINEALRTLATTGGQPIVLEARSQRPGAVRHFISVSESRAAGTTSQLRAALPGLGMEAANEPAPTYSHAVELRFSSNHRPISLDRLDAVSRSILTSLNRIGGDEMLSLQWWLLRPLAAMPVSSTTPISTTSLIESVLRAPFTPPPTIDNEARTALRNKRREAGFRAVGRIGVRAASESRAKQLVRGVADALRTAEAPGVRFTLKRIRDANRPPRRAQIRLNTAELAAVCAWPAGRTADVPVERLGSRRVPASTAVARSGRVLGMSSWPGRARPLALVPIDSTRGTFCLGPNGTGKSNLALQLILQDAAAGRSICLVEPSGDLVRDVLARLPESRLRDVVVIDPTDTAAAVGLNPLAGPPETAELRADQLFNTFHSLYASSWGPRVSEILSASLLTLVKTDGMSLPALPLLLTDARFRRKLVGNLDDPLGLEPFWAQYESWSDAERTVAIAPVLRRLHPFLVRSTLRRMIGQGRPRFDLGSVFSERRILLVNLARGEIGPEAADLLGALILSGLWQHAQGRTRTAVGERDMVSIFLDEFPTYLHLPVDLGDALARGRALGLGFFLIAQHLNQLDERMRADVLANCRSSVTFQLSPKDAGVMASTTPLLGQEDFTSLDRFHFYARLMGEGAVQPWCSGVTSPPPEPSIDPERVRQASRERYAISATKVDDELRSLFQPSSAKPKADDFAPRRRTKGEPS